MLTSDLSLQLLPIFLLTLLCDSSVFLLCSFHNISLVLFHLLIGDILNLQDLVKQTI